MVTLATFRTNLRTDLGASSSEFPDDDIDRAVQRAVRDLSRYIPREQLLDLTVDASIDDESFTSSHDAWVSLNNGWLEPLSETVTDSTDSTTYTRDTDYTMDYAQGRIQVLSTGSMADATSFLIDYTKHRISIDLSDISDFLRVVAVEWPAGNVPQKQMTFNVWGDQLIIAGRRNEEQEKLSDGDHVWVYYFIQHTAPTVSSAGTYPAELDEVVSKGAQSFMLRMRGSQYLLRAANDHNQSRQELVLSSQATSKINTPLAAAVTALDKITTHLTGSANSVQTVLKLAEQVHPQIEQLGYKVDEALHRVNSTLTASAIDQQLTDTGGTQSAVEDLDDVESLVSGPLNDADTALSKVTTHLTSASNSAKALLDVVQTDDEAEVQTALDDANTVLDSVGTTLGSVDSHLEGAGSAESDMDDVADLTTGPLSDAKTALDKISTALTNLQNRLTNFEQVDEGEISNILNAARIIFRGALSTLTAANTDTLLTGASDSAKAELDDVNDLATGPLGDADTALDAAVTNVGTDAPASLTNAENIWSSDTPAQEDFISDPNASESIDAKAMLDTGDDLINAINDGESVAELYRRYADSALGMADQFADRRKDFLRQAEAELQQGVARVRESTERVNIANTKIDVASQRINIVQSFLNKATEQSRIGNGLIDRAAQRIAFSQQKLRAALAYTDESAGHGEDARSRVAIVARKIDIAATRIDIARGFVDEAIAHSREGEGKVAEAAQRVALMNSKIQVAQGYRDVAIGFVNESDQRQQIVDRKVAIASTRIDIARAYMEEAALHARSGEGFVSEINALVTLANSRLQTAQGYANIATSFSDEAQQRIGIADQRITEGQNHLQIAQQYGSVADQSRTLAVDFFENSNRLYDEFVTVLQQKAEYSHRFVNANPLQNTG